MVGAFAGMQAATAHMLAENGKQRKSNSTSCMCCNSSFTKDISVDHQIMAMCYHSYIFVAFDFVADDVINVDRVVGCSHSLSLIYLQCSGEL